MATVLGMLSTRLKDSEGVIANHELFFTFDDAKTLANIVTFSDAYLAVLDPMTEAEIIQQIFRIILPFSGLKGSPVADSDLQETLLQSYVQTGATSKWGDDIGAYIDAINVNGRIDLSNATLTAYAGFLVASHSGFVPSGRLGNALQSLYSGVETFRTKRRALNALSRTLA